jgi:glycosyltransferase involved in cell wall biosynthesis
VKVSVLVPVCNGAVFLAECLESILAQDFSDMEILIADDASTDGSVELVERYAARDSRIRWWENPNNLGLARNFNCCLRAAKGEYIKYVLQDDKLISPLAIRKMVEMLDNHPEVSLVSSETLVLDEHSRVVELRKYFKPGIMEGRQVIVRCLERLSNMIGEPSVVMFRREQAAWGYNEQLYHWLDVDLWFRLLEQGRFAYMAEPLCAFRRHAAQQSEINRRNNVSKREQYLIFKAYFGKHCGGNRRALFILIYSLQKTPRDEQTLRLIADLMVLLKPGWYSLYWLERKITRPFENLKNWLVKNHSRKLYRRELSTPNSPVV